MSAMNNRLAMTLAVGAGYLLGRTKKAKLALGVGGMVLGKRLNLNPQQLTGLLTEQLKNNPQLAEVRDQLRNDLQGVGKAAATAVVTRRLDALSDRLHDRTLGVQDSLGAVGGKVAGGTMPGGSTAGSDGDRDEDEDEAHGTGEADAKRGATGKGGGTEKDERPARKPARAAKKAPASGAGRPAKKTAASTASSTASSAGKSGRAAKKTTARRRTTGGDDRG
ncbi:DNA primase [Streptomyces sp. S07_1.15]|uniref:DNA primase n=1 Tax=Streptomyces sp. S07_1.15 TaxID=2873925 RepID=UPI001D14D310|nr:DNA primase [Streptomyces sp. S07_1.15]MCC3654941.1 DNA primase [Streptomyces sp. S07_1.15]